MKQVINLYDFERAFAQMDRQDQFSYHGKKALFEYLEQYEEDAGEELELDVIALCCDYAEYEDFEDWQKDYYTPESIEDGTAIQNIEDLRDYTTVIEFEGGIIVGAF